MAYLLGVDTGGTYTDAVVLDDTSDRVVAKAKALTTRPDLSGGVIKAIGRALEAAAVTPSQIGLVSLSTTLATNALVEQQGGRIALVFIGFSEAELGRSGLEEALAGDPVLVLAGGHSHSGAEAAPMDAGALQDWLGTLPDGITGVAVAASFGTRNPAHEQAARTIIRSQTGLPVTCSHELSHALGGPKRALTAVLNARLIGLIDGLVSLCERHLTEIGITAPLTVVRGDGALISAAEARDKPIETILSGPAASIAGAQWLTGLDHALVSDIGGTTTDICLLEDGRPKIDPDGARVGPYRTMVEAVAMRTHGLGGDSEVHLTAGLTGGLELGPRRVMPVSLLAVDQPELVHGVLDQALSTEGPSLDGGQFAVPLWDEMPKGLDTRETKIAERLASGPARLGQAVQARIETAALQRMVGRGQVAVCGITASDAAHVLGMNAQWDTKAAHKALTVAARQRNGSGDRIAPSAQALAQKIVERLQKQTEFALLETALVEDQHDWSTPATDLARHELLGAGLDGHSDLIKLNAALAVPVIGLGASAGAYYPDIGRRLGTKMIVPDHADVANAIGAVVGQMSIEIEGTITSQGAGSYATHSENGVTQFADPDSAVQHLEATLSEVALSKAEAMGLASAQLLIDRNEDVVDVDGTPMFLSATIRVTATGRPRITMT